MLLYRVGSTSTPTGSELSLAEELIGVDACFFKSKPNLSTRSLAYFSWDMKIPSFVASLEGQENSLAPHHTNFEFFLHFFQIFLSECIDWWTKHNVININLIYKKRFLISFDKRVWSAWPLLKPRSKRYDIKRSYHALGTCFNPYRAFFNRRTWSQKWGSWNPFGCSINTSFWRSPFKNALFTSIW